MASLGDLMMRLGLDTTAFNAALGGIEGRLKQASVDSEKAWAPLMNVGQSLAGLGAGLSAAVTLPIAGIAAEAIKVSENLNLATLAFTTMLGSGEKANTFLAELQQFAASTPFEFPELVTAAKRMMAMGFESNQVLPTLRSIGDAAAALGGGAEFINGVTTALGQMQAKGKVSAEEMNQLAERGVPAWKLLADAIGLSIPEAMKKAEQGAIKAADAIPAILQGMNDKFGGQMAKTSQTLTGVWSNFKDQVTLVLADIGKQLTPIATQIVTALGPILQWARDGVTWFTQLPEPVRNAGLAFAGIMAVVGPMALALGGVATGVAAIGTAIAPIAAAIGITTGAFLGWAAAIPLVVAALVGLGTWVYDNWEPIKATVLQAWDGLTEMWSAQWGAATNVVTSVAGGLFGFLEPIIEPLKWLAGAMWDNLKGQWQLAWSGLTAIFTPVWNALKSGFEMTFNGISEVLRTFLGWAEKIPGVNKLMNLDEAWTSAKKMSTETKKVANATEDLKKKADAAAGTGKPIPKLSGSIAKVGTEAKAAETKIKPLIDRQTELTETARILTDRHDKAEKSVAALKEKLYLLKDAVTTIDPPTDAFNTSLQAIIASSADLSKTGIPGVIGQIDGMKGATMGLNEALGALGVKSQSEYDKVAREAKEAYDVVVGSGMATPTEQNNAMLAMLKAQAEAMRANRQQIPADMQATMEDLERRVTGANGLPKVKGAFESFSVQVSTIMTDWSRDSAKILFDGDKSWGEKFRGMIGGLGEAMTRLFIEPAQKALGDFMAGTIQDLIGGKGFGGVIDRVKQLGDVISDVFGGGSNVAGSVGGTAAGGASAGGTGGGGGVPGVSGGGSAAGGAASSGLMGAINLVTGIVSAVSDVITAIYAIRQEGTLNAIEHNTRYGMMYLGEHGGWSIMDNTGKSREYLGYLNATADAIGRKLDDWLSPLPDLLGDLNTRFEFAVQRLDQIGNDVLYGSRADHDSTALLGQIRDSLASRAMQVTIHVAGAANPQATGNEIMRQLRAQGAF